MTQADSRFALLPPGVAPKRARWVLMDETDLHLCPDLDSRCLHPVGQQPILRAPGQDQVAYLFGSVDPFTGEGLYEIYARKRSIEFCLHLAHLHALWPDDFLFIGCDNAPTHHSQATLGFLKDHQEGVELVYFPTYSPNLNGIEHLWAYLRQQLTRTTAYPSLREECEAICAWLVSLPFERIMQTLGTLKKLTKAA